MNNCLQKIVCYVVMVLVFLFQPVSVQAESNFEIHFLDVGQGDSAIIICDDRCMLIDGGESGYSSLVFSYLTDTLGIEHIDYMIATHPHDDHIGGLSAALNACTVGEIYSSVSEYESKAFSSFVKYVVKQGKELVQPVVGDTIQLGTSTVQFLAPLYEYADTNNNSIVVRIVYGNTSFILTGDAEVESLYDITNTQYDLSSTLYKVGYHGSQTGTIGAFLEKVHPQYCIISVGEHNEYGHPDEKIIEQLQTLGAVVYRTDMHGHIICRSDGKTLTFETQHMVPLVDLAEDKTESDDSEYVGNRNTKKFHYAECSSVSDMKDNNKVFFDNRNDAVSKGFTPCKRCNP